MEREFEGRVAIVTGASSGIGAATADLFEERGARVIRASRSTGFDVSNEADVARLLEQPCDILVNNAGTIEVSLLHQMTTDAWDRTFAVNVRGAYLMCKYALPAMIARRSGAIVNVASI